MRERTFFLGERYLAVRPHDLPAATRLAPCAPVRHLWSIVIDEEELCLDVFEAPSSEDIHSALNRRGASLDRLVSVRIVNYSGGWG